MPLTYGGIPLMVPGADALAWVQAKLNPTDLYEFEQADWPSFSESHFAFRPTPPRKPFRLNVLHWPRGASQWATFHFLASANQLNALRPLIYVANVLPEKYQPLPLVMDDGKHKIATAMWMIPPRHISEFPGRNDLSLVTLVDERFFWWERAASIAVTGGTTTWAELYAAIATGLGVTITADTVAAAYLKPSKDFSAAYKYLPTLLDAIAVSTGQRIVRTLAGAVLAQNATSALAKVKTQFAAGWPIEAGGAFAFDPLNQPCDLRALVPENVVVTFPRTDSAVLTPNVTPYTVSLLSLALPEYKLTPGHPGTKLFQGNTIAAWTGGAAPTNDAELQSLAEQIATDFYRWSLGKLDVKFARIAPWVPEALHEVEWTWQAGEMSTRVTRGPWNDMVERVGAHGTAGAVDYSWGGDAYFSSLVVNGVVITGSSSGITSIEGDSGGAQTGPGITLTAENQGDVGTVVGAGNVLTIQAADTGTTGLVTGGSADGKQYLGGVTSTKIFSRIHLYGQFSIYDNASDAGLDNEYPSLSGISSLRLIVSFATAPLPPSSHGDGGYLGGFRPNPDLYHWYAHDAGTSSTQHYTCAYDCTQSVFQDAIGGGNNVPGVGGASEDYVNAHANWWLAGAVISHLNAYTPPDHDGGTTYATGDTVVSVGVAYVSLQDSNVGNTPPVGYTPDAWWRRLSTYSGTGFGGFGVLCGNGSGGVSLYYGQTVSTLIGDVKGGILTSVAANPAINYILVGQGTGSAPVWTAPTGTGSPVEANAPTMTNAIINQTANGDTSLSGQRFTDTASTGNFENWKNAAGTSLWKVDIDGVLRVGTIDGGED